MKFRYKVLIINLILLSLSLGVIGYLMIRRNFDLAKDTQLKNAIVQNNLLQSSVEYAVLQLLNNSERSVETGLSDIGEQVASSLRTTDTSFSIRYGNDEAYFSGEQDSNIPEHLFDDLKSDGKNYVIVKEDGKHYIYVTSFSKVQKKNLYIISKSNISEAYNLLEEQVKYFRFALLGILLADSVVIYLLSTYLTRPLEQLNHISEEMAQGDYTVKADVNTADEIGLLAQKFNVMSQAVSEHIEELNDMIHRRDQFVADFTHEIKTPMTTIIGYADTMRSIELPREEELTALTYIFSEGKRLEKMSQKLFELIYLRQHDIEKSHIHVSDMANQIVKIISPAMAQKHLQIISDIEPAVIEGNQELLITVFVNLLDNARKASSPNQQILFQGRAGNQEHMDYYEFSVIDYGIGMSEEEVKNICNEFYMADKSRARKEGGAGIGMSLVAVILEHHEAKLTIQSTPGKGTHIQVRFYKIHTDKEEANLSEAI